MSNLEFLTVKANEYDLVAEFINDWTIKLYSPRFFFDSWLIKDTEQGIELWHLSKKNNLKKCSYHLQSIFPKKFKLKALEKISSHNNYVAFYKKRNRINLVDRVLNNSINISTIEF